MPGHKKSAWTPKYGFFYNNKLTKVVIITNQSYDISPKDINPKYWLKESMTSGYYWTKPCREL